MRVLKNPILILILVISLSLGFTSLTRGHDWGDDFASYIMQGESILNGDVTGFIKQNMFTIQNSSFLLGPVTYPWGYPLLLTPVLALNGLHPLPLKIPDLIFFIGFLICLYFLIKDRLTTTESLLLVALFAFNPTLIQFLDQILSDIPFLFFVFLGLLIVATSKLSGWKTVGLGVILFFPFFVRTTGIILLASFLAYNAIQFYYEIKERKAIFINSLLSVLTFGLLWLLTTLLFPSAQSTYIEQLKGLTLDILIHNNIPGYFHLFVNFFENIPNPAGIYVGIYYVLIVFFLLGAWTQRRTDQLLLIFFVLYLVAILFWPEWQGIRFIFPLLPLFFYFAFQGIKALVHRLPEKSQPISNRISYGFWLIIISAFLFNSSASAYANLKDNRQINGPFDSYSMEVYNFIKTKTPTQSIIVFYKPRAMSLFTGHNTLLSTECGRLSLGNYVVISKKADNSQLSPNQIDECGLGLKDVFENRRFIIYQVPK
jgi:hypothetical protein